MDDPLFKFLNTPLQPVKRKMQEKGYI